MLAHALWHLEKMLTEITRREDIPAYARGRFGVDAEIAGVKNCFAAAAISAVVFLASAALRITLHRVPGARAEGRGKAGVRGIDMSLAIASHLSLYRFTYSLLR